MLNSVVYLFKPAGSNNTVGELQRRLRMSYFRMNPLGEDYPYRRQLMFTSMLIRDYLQEGVTKDADPRNQ